MKATLAKPYREEGRLPDNRRGRETTAPSPRLRRFQPAIVLIALLTGFVLLQCSLPLASAIKIGADEDFAISKAFLSLKGYKLYSEVWNDQPPLHTFLLKSIFQHVSASILAARMLTVAATLALLSAIFLLVLRINGLLTAALATALAIASPGFLELSASAMVELPGLAPVLAALLLLYLGPTTRWRLMEALAGIVFAIALQIKLIGAVYLPLVLLILWLRHRESPRVIRQCAWSGLVFGLTVVSGFLAINYGTGESLSAQFAQSRASHFSTVRSVEYGLPADHPFDWTVLLKSWDTTLPAIIGVFFLVRRVRQSPVLLFPLAWLGLTLTVFTTYKPWWNYYYVHNAIPLCWCAAVGIASVWTSLAQRLTARVTERRCFTHAPAHSLAFPLSVAKLRHAGRVVPFAVFALCAAAWMGGRLYLQAADICKSPRIESALVLKEIERYKPFTEFLFTTEAVFAFHTGIPLPPKLATLSLKRFWTGDMTNAKLVEEMRAVHPGILLLASDTRELPFQELLRTDYRLVYSDGTHRLYVLPKIIEQAEPW